MFVVFLWYFFVFRRPRFANPERKLAKALAVLLGDWEKSTLSTFHAGLCWLSVEGSAVRTLQRADDDQTRGAWRSSPEPPSSPALCFFFHLSVFSFRLHVMGVLPACRGFRSITLLCAFVGCIRLPRGFLLPGASLDLRPLSPNGARIHLWKKQLSFWFFSFLDSATLI